METKPNNQTKLRAKIASVQHTLGPVLKEKENDHYKSSYFDINLLLAQLKPLLAENKLAVEQKLQFADGRTLLVTRVTDLETGEDDSVTIPLPENVEPQKLGSAITFYRRYSLTSWFIVEGEEDDDGNATKGTGNKASKPADPTDKPPF